MKHFVCLLLLGCGLAWGNVEEEVKPLEAVITGDGKGKYIVDILSAEKLESPMAEYSLDKWVSFMPAVEQTDGRWIHRLNAFQALKPKTLIKLRMNKENGKQIELVRFVVPALAEGDTEKHVLRQQDVQKMTKAQWDRFVPQGQPAILTRLINAHRARHGLNPLQYDATLNISDGPSHSAFYRSGHQAAAWSSTSSASHSFSMWRNSGGHNAQMLMRGIKRCGFGYGNGTNFIGAY